MNLMSNGSQCKCRNPESGLHSCPVGYNAICIRGIDRKCNSDCIEIPATYSRRTDSFDEWIFETARDRVIELLRLNSYSASFLQVLKQKKLSNGGEITFQIPNAPTIYVNYSFKFENDEK